jgi:hypothetical protein
VHILNTSGTKNCYFYFSKKYDFFLAAGSRFLLQASQQKVAFMHILITAVLLISDLAVADYVITGKGGIGSSESYLAGGELTYYAFGDYLEVGGFGEARASSVFAGIVTRAYVPLVGLFADLHVGNGIGVGAGIRFTLPVIDLKPFVSVASTTSSGYTTAGLMASIKL